MSFIIAQRTGRTLQELHWGGPGCDPMSITEFNQWAALITIIEPGEAEERQRG